MNDHLGRVADSRDAELEEVARLRGECLPVELYLKLMWITPADPAEALRQLDEWEDGTS